MNPELRDLINNHRKNLLVEKELIKSEANGLARRKDSNARARLEGLQKEITIVEKVLFEIGKIDFCESAMKKLSIVCTTNPNADELDKMKYSQELEEDFTNYTMTECADIIATIYPYDDTKYDDFVNLRNLILKTEENSISFVVDDINKYDTRFRDSKRIRNANNASSTEIVSTVSSDNDTRDDNKSVISKGRTSVSNRNVGIKNRQYSFDEGDNIRFNPETQYRFVDDDTKKTNAGVIATAVGLSALIIAGSIWLGYEIGKKDKKEEGRVRGTTPTTATSRITTSKEAEKVIEAFEPVETTTVATTLATTTSIEENPKYAGIDKEKLIKLVTIGYREDKAINMLRNFDEETINELLESPYLEEIIPFVKEKNFKLDYLDEYVDFMTRLGLSSTQAVDYTNRAHEIHETSFFQGRNINEIVEIVMDLDNENVKLTGNYLDNVYNVAFNEIVADYILPDREITEDTIKKLDGLKYLAKDNSDMDNFLERLHELLVTVFKNPEDNIMKDELYKFIRIFAYGVNGWERFQEYNTPDRIFNEDAVVEDFLNYRIAYESFIKPVIPVANYKDLDNIDAILIEEFATDTIFSENKEERIAGYKNAINEKGSDYIKSHSKEVIDALESHLAAARRYLELQETQYYAETALLDASYTDICGNERIIPFETIEEEKKQGLGGK